MLRRFSGTDLGLNRCRRTDDSGRSHNWFRLSRGNMSLVRRKKDTVFAAGTPHARSRLHTCMFEHVCRKFFCKMNATRQSYREQTVLCMTYQQRERGFRLCGGNRSLTPAISHGNDDAVYVRHCVLLMLYDDPRSASYSANSRGLQTTEPWALLSPPDTLGLQKWLCHRIFLFFFLAVFSVEVCRASENNHSGWAKG